MPSDLRPTSKGELLDQLAGITGIGWTVSVLGFLSAVVDYGGWDVAQLGADPMALLALGCLLFATTLVLDRLRRAVDEER